MKETINSNLDRFRGPNAYEYQREQPHQLRRKVLTELLVETTNPGSPFLNPHSHTFQISEVGIGNGFLAKVYEPFLQQNLISPTNITGIDLVGDHFPGLMQDRLIDNGVIAVAEQVPLETDSQDAIILSEVLEHTRTPIISLREIQRILRPGGTFVGSVPNSGQAWDIINMLRGDAPHQIRRKVYDPSFTHESHFTANLLIEALSEAGFTDIQLRTNMARLFPKSDMQIPVLSDWIKRKFPRFGDRLIWSATKENTQPENTGNYPSLYLITGAPRTGKSTISQQLADATDAHYVSVTDIRYRQTEGKPKYIPEENARAYVEAYEKVVKAIQSGENVIWDATFSSDAARDHIRNLMIKIKQGYRIVPIMLTADPDEVALRVAETYPDHLDKDVTPERAAQLVEDYRQMPGSIKIDTTFKDPADIVRMIQQV